MATWLIVILAVYGIGVIGFFAAMYYEAPKHKADIGVLHFIVAFGWPLWIIWYIFVIISDKLEQRKGTIYA